MAAQRRRGRGTGTDGNREGDAGLRGMVVTHICRRFIYARRPPMRVEHLVCKLNTRIDDGQGNYRRRRDSAIRRHRQLAGAADIGVAGRRGPRGRDGRSPGPDERAARGARHHLPHRVDDEAGDHRRCVDAARRRAVRARRADHDLRTGARAHARAARSGGSTRPDGRGRACRSPFAIC